MFTGTMTPSTRSGRYGTGLLACIIMLAALLLSGCAAKPPEQAEQSFSATAPQLGTKAPDFTLYDLRGNEQELTDWFGEKPLVVQLGSHTSTPFRNSRRGMSSLYEKYQEQVNFILIYTLEAHPYGSKSPYRDEEWVTVRNQVPAILVPQHTSLQERMMVASMSKTELKFEYLFLVDSLDNVAWQAYGSAPSPAFVIDRNGFIALRQASVDPGEIDKTLAQLLTPQPVQ